MSYDFTGFKLTQKNENTFLFCKYRDDGSFDCNGHIYFHFLANGQGMAITGDFGSWILSRVFYPKMSEKLSRGYFIEKVHNKEAMQFDSDFLYKNIVEYIKEYFSDLKEDELSLDELKAIEKTENDLEWMDFIYEFEGEYIVNFERDLNRNGIDLEFEWESAPEYKIPNPWLENIMDAYDYIFDNQLEITGV